MFRIKPLPQWCITNLQPGFYDTDSKTTIEQTAKLYKAIQELIEDYNKFVSEIETSCDEFELELGKCQKDFMDKMTKLIHDYIAMIDEKIKTQDAVIDDSIVYIKENLQESVLSITESMIENNEFDEVVLTAFENLGATVEALETLVASNKTEIEGRVSTLENTVLANKTEVQASVNELAGVVESNKTDIDSEIASLGESLREEMKETLTFQEGVGVEEETNEYYNGKRVYRKIFKFTPIILNPEYPYSEHNITDINPDVFVRVEGIVRNEETGEITPCPRFSVADQNLNIDFTVSKQSITFYPGSAYTGYPRNAYITLYYTKAE